MTERAPAWSRAPEVLAGVVAFALGGLHLLLRPRTGTDIAAQIARTSFADAHPFTPVGLSWYAGVDTGRTTVAVRSDRPAEVELKVRWSRWLSVDGPAWGERDGAGTRLRFSGAGTALVGSRLDLRPTGHC